MNSVAVATNEINVVKAVSEEEAAKTAAKLDNNKDKTRGNS